MSSIRMKRVAVGAAQHNKKLAISSQKHKTKKTHSVRDAAKQKVTQGNVRSSVLAKIRSDVGKEKWCLNTTGYSVPLTDL